MLLLLLSATLIGLTSHLREQEVKPSADPSPLRITAIDVQPAHPGPDTLCKLRVRIRNGGAEAATDLTFDVTVSGLRLASYLNHSWHVSLPAGEETELQLYNFWTSEAGRPFPKDGRLVVDVRLTGARWRGKESGATGAAVTPLPASMSLTLGPKRP